MSKPVRLAELIRGRRTAALLTQEELAERAGISVRTVSDIERGLRRSVYRDTAERLADALNVGSSERDDFVWVARRRIGPSKGGSRPEPGWKSLERGHIPIPPTPLVGREREIELLLAALSGSTVRVITLTGPGGIGKTRLAAEGALKGGSLFPAGVFFVPLGTAKDPMSVVSRIGESVGIVDPGTRSVGDIANHLGKSEMLLLLDTFEHVLGAAASVAQLVSLCQGLTVLVTSREPLRIRGEHVIDIPPLDLPQQGSNDLLSSASGRLLLDRARAAGTELLTDDRAAVLLGDICRQLDGFPLAIELAAPRIRSLPLSRLRDQLQTRLAVLTGGGADLPERQRSMRATLAWSYDLLEAEERSMFRSLSAFEGGWTYEAAERVVVAEGAPSLDTLSSLVDKSLIVLSRSATGSHRYSMMGVIAEFAAEQRDRCGETTELVDRHAGYFLSVAEEAEKNIGTSMQEQSYLQLLADHDNLRSALRRSFSGGDPQAGLRLATLLWQFWRALGYLSEGRFWLEQGLAAAGNASNETRANALWGASWLAFQQDDLRAARRYSNELLQVTLADEMSLARRHALTVQAMILMAEGDHAAALPPLELSTEIADASGSSWFMATSRLNLALALLHLRQLDRAGSLLNEALQLYEQVGDQRFVSRAHTYLGHLALLKGDVEGANNVLQRALESSVEVHDHEAVAAALEGSAAVSAATGSMQTAALLVGAASRVREQAMSETLPFEHPLIDSWLDEARATLGDETWIDLVQRGSALNVDEAVALRERE